MTGSAAHQRAHRAALTTETESNLLTNKTRGANDEIHRPSLCFADRILFGDFLRLARFPFRIQLDDGRTDGEATGVDGEILEFIRDSVAVLRFLGRNAGLVHFFGLGGDVVKNFADRGDAFLAANLAVAGNEERVFVEGGKFLQRIAPAGDGGFFVKAHGVPAAEEEVARVDNVLLWNPRYNVGS